MSFMNALFPAKCVICQNLFIFKDQNLFCDGCLSMIKKEYVEHCSGCGNKIKNCQLCLKRRLFHRLRIFKNNDRYITDLIYHFKIKGYKRLSTVIAEKIKEDLEDFVREERIDLVTYIPLDKTTLKERGFNHLEEILKNIFPSYLIFEIVEKTEKTKLQMDLSRDQRLINLKGVFSLKDTDIKDRRVLIFDDIMTTGSTMKEVCNTVKKGKPEKVYGYVIAR